MDTLKLATRLEAGGFTVDQARAVAGALGDAAQVADLVTNADLRSPVYLLEQQLTVRMGGMLVVLAGILLLPSSTCTKMTFGHPASEP